MNDSPGKPHFHVTAGLIRRGGRLLITKRRPGGHLEGMWEFPGGKQEQGESLEECIEREIMEELGLAVRASGRLCSIEHEYPEKRITLHLFECDCLSGSPIPQEGQETRWVRPEELHNFDFPPPDSAFIRKIAGTSDK